MAADMLTVTEAADALRMSERNVRHLVTTGALTAFQHRPGARILIPAEAIMAYLRPAYVVTPRADA